MWWQIRRPAGELRWAHLCLSTSLISHLEAVMHEDGFAPRLPHSSPSDSVKQLLYSCSVYIRPSENCGCVYIRSSEHLFLERECHILKWNGLCVLSARPMWRLIWRSLLIRRLFEISRGSHNSYLRLPPLCGDKVWLCDNTKADCSVTTLSVWTAAGAVWEESAFPPTVWQT